MLSGADMVVEHHSDFEHDNLTEDEREIWREASASWDAPVVVTTAVQLFESLYAARKRRCRKLHSLAGAVIVLDEAQTLPRPFLRPCFAALTELVEGYGASIVLCTATQSSLTTEAGFPRELAPDPAALHNQLRRVRLTHIGGQDDEALAARMREAERALLIVDNRVQARDIFDRLQGLPGAMHLSTLMTPVHRRNVLATVRERMAGDGPVRLVSTSLVEAGVDLDFPLVLRAEAGLDRIAQAAGRCNREGRLDGLGDVLVFEPEQVPPPDMRDAAEKMRKVLDDHESDPFSGEAITAFFKAYWRSEGDEGLDASHILKMIQEGRLQCPFEDVEAAFKLIDDEGPTVIVRDGRWGVPDVVWHDLREAAAGSTARALQPYTVGVPWRVWNALKAAGVISWWREARFGEQFPVLDSSAAYDEDAGLSVDGFDDIGDTIL